MKSWATSSFGDGLLLGLVEKLAVGVEMVQPAQPGYFEWFGVVGVVGLDALRCSADGTGALREYAELDSPVDYLSRQRVLRVALGPVRFGSAVARTVLLC